jgi:hypothetical protein
MPDGGRASHNVSSNITIPFNSVAIQISAHSPIPLGANSVVRKTDKNGDKKKDTLHK